MIHDAAGACEPDYHRRLPGSDRCRCGELTDAKVAFRKMAAEDPVLSELMKGLPPPTPFQQHVIEMLLTGQTHFEVTHTARREGKAQVDAWIEALARQNYFGHIHLCKRDETVCFGQDPPCTFHERTEKTT